MKPELTLSDLKIVSFTANEFVQIKIALNNHEKSLATLVILEKHLESIYRTELSQLKEAQKVLSAAMRRDP